MATVGSLFSGVGGLDEGFVRAGFNLRWQCEVDGMCRDVRRRHFPEERLYDDIRTVNWEQAERVDVITGGFPCQDLSVAGRRAGLDGERSGLFWQFVRVIECLRPELALIENVPGLLSSHRGRDMAILLGALQECGALDIRWRLLDAQYFGVAQQRKRLFIVADFRARRASEILAHAEGMQGHPAPRREAGKDPPRTAPQRVGVRGLTANGRTRTRPDREVTHPLTSGGADATEDGSGRGTPLVAVPIGERDLAGAVSAKWAKQSGGPAGDEAYNLVAHSLRARGYPTYREDSEEYVMVSRSGDDAVDDGVTAYNLRNNSVSEGTAYTLGAKHTTGYSLNYQPVIMPTPMAVRRLTPTECERLMGMDDGWTARGASGKKMSDSKRYQMTGNAVVVPVAEWIAARMLIALESPLHVRAETRHGKGLSKAR